jgi:hypothetical protein
MPEIEWVRITKEEFDKLDAKLMVVPADWHWHTVTICEPPQRILWENTGKESQLDERWFLMIRMDWMGPKGEIVNDERFYQYYKNVKVIGEFEGSKG